MTAERAESWLKLLLRVFGAATGLAIVAVFMPTVWMDACHRAILDKPLPDGPVVVYLARSLSGFYAIFGGLLILTSVDVRRYAAVINYLAAVCIVASVAVTALDAMLALPWWWTALEAPPLLPAGLLMIVLLRKVRQPPAEHLGGD